MDVPNRNKSSYALYGWTMDDEASPSSVSGNPVTTLLLCF